MLYDFTAQKVVTSVPSWDACYTFDIPFAVNLKEKMDSIFKPSSDNAYFGNVTPAWSKGASFDLIKYTDLTGVKSVYVNKNADLEYVSHSLEEGTFFHLKKPMATQNFTDADFTIPGCEGKKLVSGTPLKQLQSSFMVTIWGKNRNLSIWLSWSVIFLQIEIEVYLYFINFINLHA